MNDLNNVKSPRIILHFQEESKTTLEKAGIFSHKERTEINYICDIYGEYSYARQESESLEELLKDLAWRIIDNDTQAYEVVIVRGPKMEELFHEIVQSLISYGIKYRVVEERETKNVIPVLRGPKSQDEKKKRKVM